ncbi:HAD-IIA family hydrolase [Agrococcus casei]|uniref:HAD-IIA family hydrolase n=1 Tax=Agrococcus casei TaxID=343512 RepID=UPI003F92A74C
MRPIDGIDLLLLDLDGVVYKGAHAIPHAVEAINGSGVPAAYLTNNAARTDTQVADHLASFGLAVRASDVVTSPQAAMNLLASHVPDAGRVLVVGGQGITAEIAKRGWQVVRKASEQPHAVVQGFAPHVSWTDLAEASFALQRGIPWVATNMDWTMPVAEGIAPGNGTLVSAVHTAVGRMPEVAGKPERPIFQLAKERFGASSPMMIGDRLDTDIEGANKVKMKTLHVLTGIDQAGQLIAAPKMRRPDYIVQDLRELGDDYEVPRETLEKSTGNVFFEVGRAAVKRSGNRVELLRAGERHVDTVRAACIAVWTSDFNIHGMHIGKEILEL